MLRSFIHLCTQFNRDRSGGVAIIFGIVMIPLVIAMGAAVDFGFAHKAKAQLNSIADATALTMLSPDMMDLPPNMASEKAKEMMKAHASTVKRIRNADFTAKVTDNMGKRTVELAYNAKMDTTFIGVAGINTVDLKGEAKSQKSLPDTSAQAQNSNSSKGGEAQGSELSAEQAAALKALASQLGVQIVIPNASPGSSPGTPRLLQ
ncbi:MAG: pilus assembly protein [Pseudolabrys sp.]|nr:pilus assembly protein [Pseudolabrys sp.]